METIWAERLVSRVDFTDTCWLWTGATDHSGYGTYSSLRRPGITTTSAAHRIFYEWLVGPIPAGLVLDHLCRVRNCVKPAHLEPVTDGENLRRSPLVLKPECPSGHRYTEGSYYLERGHRTCKQCKRDQVAAYTARTNRTTATFVCEHCGETRNRSGRSRHIRAVHPEHYTPRQRSEGMTPERKARALELQRLRRRVPTTEEKAS